MKGSGIFQSKKKIFIWSCVILLSLFFMLFGVNLIKNSDKVPGRREGEETASVLDKKIVLGNFELDQDSQNGKESIVWTVIDETEDSLLILSDDVLFASVFSEEFKKTDWDSSVVKKYLNTVFYEEAFDDEERGLILDSDEGFVFILNKAQYYRCFLTQKKHENVNINPEQYEIAKINCIPTALAVSQGALKDENGEVPWLLRPDTETHILESVKPDGTLIDSPVIDDSFGIRPAVWVSSEILGLEYAKLKGFEK